MAARTAAIGLLWGALCATSAAAQEKSLAASIDVYLAPYVRTGNFSGAVWIEKSGKPLFQKGYGFSDRRQSASNTEKTRFHIASVSMQFTAAAVMRLVDDGKLDLDGSVAALLPTVAGADKIRLRDLLTERSGLADINDLPEYNDFLQQHQTPASLVEKIGGRPLLFEPGTKRLHEEHSAYNALALIVEKKTGLPFAAALRQLVLRPLGMADSFADDDSLAEAANQAKGYEPVGLDGVAPAAAIHWSAKTGNGSMCTTVEDEARWVRALFQGSFLGRSSRDAMLADMQQPGYGWFRGKNLRFGRTAYYMNGRAPGFASFVLYLPDDALTVIVFSNIYSSATTSIGYDLASIALGLPHGSFLPSAPLSDAALRATTGVFQFGPDFYQKNARLELVQEERHLGLRWPSGYLTALIPLEPDHFLDRSYWEDVRVERDSSHSPSALVYGQFRGTAAKRD